LIILKKFLQKLLRLFHISILKKDLPNKICIYFHDLKDKEKNDLEKIILYFKKNGFRFVNFNDLNNNLETNEKLISLTFDDGFSSWVDTLKLFQKHNIKVTFFLNTIFLTQEPIFIFLKNIDFYEKDKLLDIHGLAQLIKSGHEIGAHTHGHFTLSKLTLKEFKKDLEKNISILNKYNIYPNTFAIPFGMRRYITNEQINYLNKEFSCIAFGEPGMLFKQKKGYLQRYPWKSKKSFNYNINNIKTDTSYFNNLTKRSGLG